MIQPIGKRILIQPIEELTGKLIQLNSKPTRYKVIACGDEANKIFSGDTIYLSKYAGTEIEHDNQKYLVIDEDCVLARLT